MSLNPSPVQGLSIPTASLFLFFIFQYFQSNDSGNFKSCLRLTKSVFILVLFEVQKGVLPSKHCCHLSTVLLAEQLNVNICHFIKLIINHQLQHKHQLNIKLMFMVIYKDQLSLKLIFIDLKTLAKQRAYQCRVLLMRHHSTCVDWL